MAWIAYRDKYGSLNLARRLELAAGMIAMQVNRTGGGKADLFDFMPHAERPGVSLKQAMSEWE